MPQSHIGELNEGALKNLRSMVDVDTIIGDAITTPEGITLIPVSKVSFGFASGGTDIGGSSAKEMFGGGTGGGVTIQPIAFLVIQEGRVEVMQLTEHGNVTDRAVSMLPGIIDQISGLFKKKTTAEQPAEK